MPHPQADLIGQLIDRAQADLEAGDAAHDAWLAMLAEGHIWGAGLTSGNVRRFIGLYDAARLALGYPGDQLWIEAAQFIPIEVPNLATASDVAGSPVPGEENLFNADNSAPSPELVTSVRIWRENYIRQRAANVANRQALIDLLASTP